MSVSREFVYLALVVDGFSRRAVGWALQRTLQTRLTVEALEMAITQRQPSAGLVHHSDQGIQYAAAEYVALLTQHRMTPSMSRPANPYDNAQCESFIKTLKREEIYAHRYQDMADLRAHIEQFIEQYYNRQRLHSALGYRTPEEFETAAQPEAVWPGASVSFPRHGEIYRWKRNGEPVRPSSPAHPIDESPVGYSLAGCSPAEPASASPTGAESETPQPE